MSTVIAIKRKGRIWMGADGFATTSDGERRRVICKKIFKNGPYLIGWIGSVRTGQTVKPEYFKAPKNVFDFPDRLLEHFKEKKCLATNTDDLCSITGSNFLIATPKGRLFEILVDFQMNEIRDFVSIGSGSPYALGSLYTTRKLKNSKKRIRKALKAATVYDTATGPPHLIKEYLY
jgi:ATP-dependent protease HslVU (ClpYQ) peptidase subunit